MCDPLELAPAPKGGVLRARRSQDLRRLNKLAKLLRRQRSASGALTLASPEVKFTLDSETMDPMDVGMYQVFALFVLGCIVAGAELLGGPEHPPDVVSLARSASRRRAAV